MFNISTTFITIIERDTFWHKESSNSSTRRGKCFSWWLVCECLILPKLDDADFPATVHLIRDPLGTTCLDWWLAYAWGCDVRDMGVGGSRQMKLVSEKGLHVPTIEHVGPHEALTWYPFKNPYMEITCAPLPKILGSWGLNSTISSTRKVPIFKGSQSALYHYKKTKPLLP